ncbi:hypothetical protein XNW1_4570042 [Xenorhabdus nematophila str. Websteri]|nr:hypothetical protein XNW1_4570042 [Xenorhabdus nematophila str. Websteri]
MHVNAIPQTFWVYLIQRYTVGLKIKRYRSPQPFELEDGFFVFDAAEIREWVENKKLCRESI